MGAATQNDDNNSEDGLPSVQPRRRVHEWLLATRRRLRVGELLFVGSIGCLIVTTSVAAYVNVVQHGWNSDAAAWAQAAGSIVAIAGAVWLARSEARAARRWRREQGEEAAWAVRFVVAQAQFDAQIVAAELTRTDKPFDLSDVRSWRQRAANASLALQTMLTRADHVHAVVVLTACNAKVLVDSLSIDLERMESLLIRDETPGNDLISDIVFAHRNLMTLVDHYDARMCGVAEALDRGRDMLPLDELGVWSRTSKTAKPQ